MRDSLKMKPNSCNQSQRVLIARLRGWAWRGHISLDQSTLHYPSAPSGSAPGAGLHLCRSAGIPAGGRQYGPGILLGYRVNQLRKPICEDFAGDTQVVLEIVKAGGTLQGGPYDQQAPGIAYLANRAFHIAKIRVRFPAHNNSRFTQLGVLVLL